MYREPLTRREWLGRAANGFGAVALSSFLAGAKPHHPARAKAVIFLYMDGGVSQVDSFDPKPLLAKYHGSDPARAIGKLEPTQFANAGKVMQSPWDFRPRGQCGMEVSDLFPHIAKKVDDIALLRGVVSKFPEHTTANYFLHTGSPSQGRPSWGAWCGYGLGNASENLPGFIVLNGGLIPPGGQDNFASGFLPAAFQGSVFKPGKLPLANIARQEASEAEQRRKLDLTAALDKLNPRAAEREIDAAIRNAETAFLMQAAVPEVLDLSQETKETKDLYGIDDPNKPTAIFAAQCLIARRLVERGVRCLELTCPTVEADRWDQHTNLRKGHAANALAVDWPIAGLLTDLKRRGLLASTLVVWAGEFGRTPFAQGTDGRDHNPHGFSIWMAGGGVKGGIIHGATDEWGYKAVQGRVEIHDLHATMLHLLGFDHTRLVFRFGGRDMRLTDVHGHVVRDILA